MTAVARARKPWRESAGFDRPPWIARIALGFVRFVAPRLERFGIEPAKLVALVELRFELDRRTARTGETPRLALGPLLLVTTLVSLAITIIMLVVKEPATAVSIIAGSLELVVPLLVVGAWIDVLLDGAAETVLGTRPVDDRTIFAARLAFLASYSASTIIAIAALPIVAGTIKHGVWPFLPGALLAVPTASVLAVLGLSAVFLLLAHVVPADRFRVWVMRMQFALAITLPLAIQIGPRLLQRGPGDAMPAALEIVIPPAWSGAVTSVLGGEFGTLTAIQALLAFSVPITLLMLVMRLARGRLAAATLAPQTESRKTAPFASQRVTTFMARLCRSNAERAAFHLTSILTLRERTYLLRTLPMLVTFIAALIPAFLLRGRGGVSIELARVVATVPFAFAVAMPVLAHFLRFSETPAAAWILATSPNYDERSLRSGAFRALLSRWCIVPSAITIVASCALDGLQMLPAALVAALAALHMGLFACMMVPPGEPFAEPYGVAHERKNMATGAMMLHSFATMGAAAGTFLFADEPVALTIVAVVLAGLLPLSWRALR